MVAVLPAHHDQRNVDWGIRKRLYDLRIEIRESNSAPQQTAATPSRHAVEVGALLHAFKRCEFSAEEDFVGQVAADFQFNAIGLIGEASRERS